MSMMKEFKEFAVKGNMIDMAVGIIIGAAFKSVVSSLVKDVIMPPIGKMLGNVDFSQLFISLGDAGYATIKEAEAAAAPIIKYGAFIQSVVDFLIIAFVIFVMVKGINSMKKKEEAAPEPAPAEPAEDIVLLREIRDSLKK